MSALLIPLKESLQLNDLRFHVYNTPLRIYIKSPVKIRRKLRA